MNLNNFTIKSQEAVERAQQVAMEQQQQAIELGHLLKGILEVDESVAPFVFKKLGVNLDIVRQATDSIVRSYPKVSGGS
nr:Clp protease N-terminal domain-containing protein [Saprospiraceae bacterium]